MTGPSSQREFDGHFDEVGRLVQESLSFSTFEQAVQSSSRAIDTSAVVAAIRSTTHDFFRLSTAERLRLIGLFLACGAATNALLLMFVPRQSAPMLPFAIPALLFCAGVVLITASSALTRVWRR